MFGAITGIILVLVFIVAIIITNYDHDLRPPKPGDTVIDLDPNGDLAYYSKNLDIRYGKISDFRD